MRFTGLIFALVLASLSGYPASAAAASPSDFDQWLALFRAEALASGIGEETIAGALENLTPDPRVLDSNAEQPEFNRPIWKYLDSALVPVRIQEGRKRLDINGTLFDQIELAYGVDRHVIAAIWAMETNFGRFMGKFNVVRSLATLGHTGRRADYGRRQLMAALRIIERGDVAAAQMVGSWAGGMGQTQFVPTSYLAYAVDHDRDGRRDLWHSLPDVLASTAHYLVLAGWQKGQLWGQEVRLPADFDYGLANPENSKTVSEWRDLGIQSTDTSPFDPQTLNIQSVLALPAGHQGPAFLLFDNFRAILRYNNSTSYALAVSKIGDALRGQPGIIQAWPRGNRPLASSERREIQERLNTLGYAIEIVDGIIGAKTRAAVRAFQHDHGLAADGYPTYTILEKLRAPG